MERNLEDRTGGNAHGGESIAELTRKLSEQSSLLATQEVALAKAEMAEKGKQLGIGAGAFGAAGIVALYAVGALVGTLILALATFLDAWLAALIVTVVLGVIAAVLALTGKKQIDEGTPPVPERAIGSTKLDADKIKSSAKEGRS
jgi:MFS family permease